MKSILAILLYTFALTLLTVDCYEFYGRYSAEKTGGLNSVCLIKVKPCTPHEGSRIDGTCNNFKQPSRGSAMGPYFRMLKPDYGHRGMTRKNRDHEPLPSARKVRTMIWSTGRVVGSKFTRAVPHFMEFVKRDISLMNGLVDYLRNRTYCCKEEGEKDPRCDPIHVPSDDPYLGVTDIRCLNFSRAETFQDLGCITKELNPEQINYQTPLLDLSTIYGVDDEALKPIRRFKNGQLKEEYRGGRYVPLNETRDFCFLNKKPTGICYKFGNPEAGNFDLTTTTLAIFFYREHNRIARILHELNPCWKDDRLFKVARQINIATLSNIFMYELMPTILGHKNMLNYHLISDQVEFVSSYDEKTDPLVFAEYDIAVAFFHTLFDGRIKKYVENYHYNGEYSLSGTSFKQELLEEQANFEEINRGTFYQKAGKIDDIVDPDISEKLYPDVFRAHDSVASSIQRSRDIGLRGYNSYRRLCGLSSAKKFEDLVDVINVERVEILKRLYKDLEDIDLLVGIMSEELIPGLFVGPTLFCIISKQLLVFRFSDRFWFEKGEQMHSFTLAQLQEIRKTNIARLACDNAEGIKFIQPRAFINVGRGNDQVPCGQISEPDLTKWKDESCRKHIISEGHPHEDPFEGEIVNYYDGDQLRGGIIYSKPPKSPNVLELYQFQRSPHHHSPIIGTYPKLFPIK